MKSWWYYQCEAWLCRLKAVIALAALAATCWMVATVAFELQARFGGDAARMTGALGTGARKALPTKPGPVRNEAPAVMVFDSAARDSLPAPPLSKADRMCLARAVYHEARGEPIEGQVAVAQVVLNRVKSKRWPKTVCGVVYEGHERGEKCQFSFACYEKKGLPDSNQMWAQAKWIADDVAAGRTFLEELGQATYYHTHAVKPVWRASLTPIRRIGQHIFYSDPKEPVPDDLPVSAMTSPATGPPPVVVANPVTTIPLDVTEPSPPVQTAAAPTQSSSQVLAASVAIPPSTVVTAVAAPKPLAKPLPPPKVETRVEPVALRDEDDDPSPRRPPPRATAVSSQSAEDRAAAKAPSARSITDRDSDLGGR